MQFNELGSRERDVILRRIGIKNGAPETLQEIATCYGITRERIRQLEFRAISRLGYRKSNIDDKIKFASVWQGAFSLAIAAKKLGIPVWKASWYAGDLRRKGIPLKQFKRGRPLGQGQKVLTKEEMSAVDPKFKKRQENASFFIKLWNKGTRTDVMAKELGYSSRAAIYARAASLRLAGYDVAIRMNTSAPSVSREDFIRIWQGARSVKDVLAKTGMSYAAAQGRSYCYGRMGIKLKKFRLSPRVTPSTLEGLKKIAEESLVTHEDLG